MMAKYCFIALTGLIGTKAHAQQRDNGALVENEKYVSLNYENDFFNATDRYYTQGILLSYVHPLVKHSPFSYTLLTLKNADKRYYGFHLQQDVFTPRSIRYKGGAIYYGERPFAAVLFMSHALTSLNASKRVLLHAQLDMGILGPEAKGAEEQKAIHKALNNIEPLGWENQLSRDYIVNYQLKLEKGLIQQRYFETMLSVKGRAGTLYTDASIGAICRVGIMDSYFKNLGISTTQLQQKRKIKAFVTLKTNLRFVAYNATLQGGLTNAGNKYQLPATAVSKCVADVSSSLALVYRRVSLEYARTFITREFKTGLNHGWGKCAVTLCF